MNAFLRSRDYHHRFSLGNPGWNPQRGRSLNLPRLYEPGHRPGVAKSTRVPPVYSVTDQSYFDRKKITEESALELFGQRSIAISSHRKKEFYRGVAAGMGWLNEKVALLDQSFLMDGYHGKLHSFAGSSSICAGREATKDGNTYTGRNLDWSEAIFSGAKNRMSQEEE